MSTGDESQSHHDIAGDPLSTTNEHASPLPAMELDVLAALAAKAGMEGRQSRKLRCADLGQRILATLIDFIALFLVTVPAVVTAVQFQVGPFPLGYVSIIILWWLLSLCDVFQDGTPGKHLLSLRIRDVNGYPPSKRQLLIRVLCRRLILIAMTVTVSIAGIRAALHPTNPLAGDLNMELPALAALVQSIAICLTTVVNYGFHEVISQTRVFEQADLIVALARGQLTLDHDGHAFTVMPQEQGATIASAGTDFTSTPPQSPASSPRPDA